jgi:hypothetical protein
MWFAVNERGCGCLFMDCPPVREHQSPGWGYGYWRDYKSRDATIINKADWPNPDQTWEDEPVECEIKIVRPCFKNRRYP